MTNVAYHCHDCKGIGDNPDHYEGDIPTPELKLKCVLYEAFTLAMAVQALKTITWPAETRYKTDVGAYDPSEVVKSAALVKFRLLHGFLYLDNDTKEFRACRDFSAFGISCPFTQPSFDGFDSRGVFTRKSINRFIAHLTVQRITKPKCMPQPKFRRAEKAIIKNASLILDDVAEFAAQVIKHPTFGELDRYGKAYLEGFSEVKTRLTSGSI